MEAEYEPFSGVVLTDTFQLSEEGNPMDEVVFPRNNARADRQKDLDIGGGWLDGNAASGIRDTLARESISLACQSRLRPLGRPLSTRMGRTTGGHAPWLQRGQID